jgi:putative sterol carrier protein
MATFLTQEWADAVKDAVNAGPAKDYKEEKLDEYWEWIDNARATFEGDLAFGVRDGDLLRDEVVVLTWSGGVCTAANASTVDQLSESAFLLAGEVSAWQDLMSGQYDAGKTVMYRRLLLDRGPLLAFFNRVYFFVEMVGVIGKVPTEFPAEVAA